MNMNMSAAPENVRPWGRYDILDEGAGFKVKRITVAQGRRLSYQRHARRSEYWTIVAGRALVTVADAPSEKTRGDTAFIPAGTKHRIENIGAEPVIFIEVQLGEYLGEDDIERFEDDYGRAA